MNTLQSLLDRHGLFLHLRKFRRQDLGVTIGTLNGRTAELSVVLGKFKNLLRCGLLLEHNGDSNIGVSLGGPGLTVHIGENIWPLPERLVKHITQKRFRHCIEYAFDIYVDTDGHDPDVRIRWNLGMDPMTWDHTDPQWRHCSVSLRDLVFGTQKIEALTEKSYSVILDLPEGKIPARLTVHSYRRQRLRTKPQYFTTAFINLEQPLVMDRGRECTGFSIKVGDNVDDMVRETCKRIVDQRVKSGLTPCGKASAQALARSLLDAKESETPNPDARMLAAYVQAQRALCPHSRE